MLRYKSLGKLVVIVCLLGYIGILSVNKSDIMQEGVGGMQLLYILLDIFWLEFVLADNLIV